MNEYKKESKRMLESSAAVAALRGKIVLVKYGGAAMEDPELRAKTSSDIALLRETGILPVVVHGAGKEISRWMKKIGLEPKFVGGLRYTDEPGMEITEMVLSGKMNSELVSLISRFGAPAVGLSGKDARLSVGKRIAGEGGEDLGFVGEIAATNVAVLHTLLDGGFTPVISCVGVDESGQTLNMNADHVAAELALALGVGTLVFLSDVDGVKQDGAVLPRLTAAEGERLISEGVISGGMIPKVRYAMRAVTKGVPRAVLTNGEKERAVVRALTGNPGTEFVAA